MPIATRNDVACGLAAHEIHERCLAMHARKTTSLPSQKCLRCPNGEYSWKRLRTVEVSGFALLHPFFRFSLSPSLLPSLLSSVPLVPRKTEFVAGSPLLVVRELSSETSYRVRRRKNFDPLLMIFLFDPLLHFWNCSSFLLPYTSKIYRTYRNEKHFGDFLLSIKLSHLYLLYRLWRYRRRL